MAAITKTQVSFYPDYNASRYVGSKDVVERRYKLTGVSAGDTASATVLGFSDLISTSNGWYSGGVVAVAVNPVAKQLVLGTGPSNADVYVTVTGVPA